MLKKLKKLSWKLFILALSLKNTFKLNLGDIVIYKNNEYYLTQGVNKPFWTLSSTYSGHEIIAHQKLFNKKGSIKNYKHSFKHNYRFYMNSWFDIWVNSGIQRWMLNCNIW